MKALHLRRDGGSFSLEQLRFEIVHLGKFVDAEGYRRRARGGGPAVVHSLSPSSGVRTVVVRSDSEREILEVPGPLLTFVVAGTLDIQTAGKSGALGRGHMILIDDGEGRSQWLRPSVGCRLVQLRVESGWPQTGSPCSPAGEPSPKAGPPNIKRMYEAAHGRSRFRPFETLFDLERGRTGFRPVAGFRFVSFADQAFIDWHPEVVNNLVIILSGELQLEVGGGGGQIEGFSAGDVCLAEDRTGEGHIDRTRGHTNVAVIVIDNEHLWEP